MSLIIDKGKDILCMRFVNVGGNDCINEHQKIMNEKGFVWFGKIGNKPTAKALDKMLSEKSNFILLKEPKNAYICEFEAYSDKKPREGEFPDYYTTEILPTRHFSLWFKLVAIRHVEDLSLLNSVVLKSSRSPVLETTKKSMASHFYTVAKEELHFK
jgi:hypothetical protein